MDIHGPQSEAEFIGRAREDCNEGARQFPGWGARHTFKRVFGVVVPKLHPIPPNGCQACGHARRTSIR